MHKFRLIDAITHANVDFITSTDAARLDEDQRRPLAMWYRYDYKSIYIPTGEVLQDHFYVRHQLDGWTLLNEWNRRAIVAHPVRPIEWIYVMI